MFKSFVGISTGIQDFHEMIILCIELYVIMHNANIGIKEFAVHVA